MNGATPTCPSCGNPLDGQSRFCGMCGFALESAAPVAQPRPFQTTMMGTAPFAAPAQPAPQPPAHYQPRPIPELQPQPAPPPEPQPIPPLQQPHARHDPNLFTLVGMPAA